jgi:hypothetical protein
MLSSPTRLESALVRPGEFQTQQDGILFCDPFRERTCASREFQTQHIKLESPKGRTSALSKRTL